MAETRTASGVDELLSNAEWLRALAGRLLQDESQVEDLVHETWVAALKRPTQDLRNLPAWLAAVASNLSRKRLRDSGRELATQSGFELALEDDAPAPDEALDLSLARRSVVHAVLALPEPFRSTVLMTFYEGLEPREIARLTGVPDATVRTRLRRALLRLRSKLERDPQVRRAGGLAMLRITAPPRSPSPAPLSSAQPRGIPNGVGLALAGASLAALAWLAVRVPQASTSAAALADSALGLPVEERPLARGPDQEPQPTSELGPEGLDARAGAEAQHESAQDHDGPCADVEGERVRIELAELPGPALPQPSLRDRPAAAREAGVEPGGMPVRLSGTPVAGVSHRTRAIRGGFAATPKVSPPSAPASAPLAMLPQRGRGTPLRSLPAEMEGDAVEEEEQEHEKARLRDGTEADETVDAIEGSGQTPPKRPLELPTSGSSQPVPEPPPGSNEELSVPCTCEGGEGRRSSSAPEPVVWLDGRDAQRAPCPRHELLLDPELGLIELGGPSALLVRLAPGLPAVLPLALVALEREPLARAR